MAPCPEYHPLEYLDEFLWIPRLEDLPIERGIPCLLLRHPGASWLLVFFHANAEDLGRIYWFLRQLKALLHVHILAVEYPGYGVCSGEATEESVLEDAEAVARFVFERLEVPSRRVLFVGRSVGGGPAVSLASRYACGGLVTLSTFSSIRAVVGAFAGWGGWFPDMFNNGERIRHVPCRTLIIHGTLDETVPVGQARELADACGSAVAGERPKVVLVTREGVGHNDLDVRSDIANLISEAFPELREGSPLALEKADAWVCRHAMQLASDVRDRVPYGPEWVPTCVPRGRIRILEIDGGAC